MVTTLAIERSSTANWGTRTVFVAAVLMTLSAFAKETATVAIDLPRAKPAHADIAPTVAPTPEASVKAPAVNVVTRTKVSTLATLTRGMASWYGKVLQGHRTASGRRFDMFEMTAAHRSLPFGSKVKVTDLRNSKSVIVTITDRGELYPDRVIDLSYAAADKLGMLKMGVDPVKLEVLTPKQVLMAEAAVPGQP
jgi:rare lipoprotein A